MTQSSQTTAPQTQDVEAWHRAQVEAEGYWFQRITLGPDFVTPGWSDPQTEKLPYYGLPEDLTGMRVLDVGCAEGFFSFECERRGAAEVVAIDSFPDSVRRFNICKAALGSKAVAYLTNVYDVTPKAFGTFDLVLFYGVLYHLRHPLLALEQILSVCTGTMLLQTAIHEDPRLVDTPMSRFYPFGMASGKNDEYHDPTIFWMPNRKCVQALTESTGFQDIEVVTANDLVCIVLRARSPVQAPGAPPDQTKAPWS